MTFVIAEAGVNHCGDLRTAEQLIVAAKRCGADAVKFQLFNAERLGRPELKELEISYGDMEGLKLYADRMGIEFMCTPFDVEAVRFLAPLVKRMKVSSGCTTNVPLLKAVRETGLPVILSTGMCDMDRIRFALGNLGYYDPGFETKITLLHCTSAYPCPVEDVNLRAMWHMEREYEEADIGYSDHTLGTRVALAAVAMGAKVIEKHITLDVTMQGPDHKASIEPIEFQAMVQGIRHVEKALGKWDKAPQPSEKHTMSIWHGER